MKLTYIAFPMLFLFFLLGCHSATSDPNPINSTSEPSQAVKDAFGGKLFYQNATPDQIARCNEFSEQCSKTKITKSDFCGLDALVFLRFEKEPHIVSDCLNKVAQELATHYVQTPEIKYVFFGNLKKRDKPELIHGQDPFVRIYDDEYALVGLVQEKNKWFIAKTIVLGVGKEAPTRSFGPDAISIPDYTEIPTEPTKMKEYFEEAYLHPDRFCNANEVNESREAFLQRYQNQHTTPGTPCREQ